MNRTSRAIGPIALTIGMAMNGQADAVTVIRDHYSHGTASCQSALPVFDGNIRKRPLAFANEGTGNAFVTCDNDSIPIGVEGVFTLVSVFFTNRGTATPSISCTLVNGGSSSPTYFPKATAPIEPGDGGFISWLTSDNGGDRFVSPAMSCNLPPGTEIDAVGFAYHEEVGA